MWSGNHLKEEFLKYVVFLKGVESFEGRVFKICDFLMWSGNHLKVEFLIFYL